MKFTINYRIDERTLNGDYLTTSEDTITLDAVNIDDATQQLFDLYAGEPHSIHVERVEEIDPYELRVRELEAEGMTRSDAQAVADAESM